MPNAECDICGSDDFARRLMGYNLCELHYGALKEDEPADMYGWLQAHVEGDDE